MASWDYYVGRGHHDYLTHGVTHDLTRGFKRRNFWIMETQPGHVNWSEVNNDLYKGEARAMAWQAVAHGADAVLYWQWRPALGGQEQYHGSLVDASGRPRPFYDEVKQLGGEFARVSDLIAGSEVEAQVALLDDYESRWSIEAQRLHKDFDYVAYFNHFARPLAANNLPLDVISADEPLEGYHLILAPALILLDEKRAASLEAHVRRGGHLVLTARGGMKDRFNALLPARQPGPLTAIAGVEVEDYYALDEPVEVKGQFLHGSAGIWAERLAVLDKNVTILARYRDPAGWLDDRPAVTVCRQGEGLVFYVAAWLDEASQHALIKHILEMTGLAGIATPPGVELSTRRKADGQTIHFVINHTRRSQSVRLPWKSHDGLSGKDFGKDFTLEPYGVAVLSPLDKK
jgi:beta-galactosidase